MSVAVGGTASGPGFFLDRKRLRDLALERRDGYRDALPYPHAVFDDLLGIDLSRALARHFPGPDHPGWMRRDYKEQAAPGGHLALHADFNRDRTRHLERKVTVLYYLAADWDPAWGGALELWDAARTQCVASYPPLLDRLIVMNHGDAYWHGHPTPLACPEGRQRASVAAYYYVAAPSPDEASAHGAIWAT